MPRWASRILLEITDVRVERLHDMSEEDAKAEGATPATYKITPSEAVYRVGFGDIWRSIYGQDNWLSNPLVWVPVDDDGCTGSNAVFGVITHVINDARSGEFDDCPVI